MNFYLEQETSLPIIIEFGGRMTQLFNMVCIEPFSFPWKSGIIYFAWFLFFGPHIDRF